MNYKDYYDRMVQKRCVECGYMMDISRYSRRFYCSMECARQGRKKRQVEPYRSVVADPHQPTPWEEGNFEPIPEPPDTEVLIQPPPAPPSRPDLLFYSFECGVWFDNSVAPGPHRALIRKCVEEGLSTKEMLERYGAHGLSRQAVEAEGVFA